MELSSKVLTLNWEAESVSCSFVYLRMESNWRGFDFVP